MQKLWSTCEGEKGKPLTGDRLGVELLLRSANRKALESPAAKGLAWPRFFRRMTSGTMLCLAGGKALAGPGEASRLSTGLLALRPGSPAGLVPRPSLCWSWKALPVCGWLREKAASSSENAKLLRSHHEESWNNVGGTELWDKVCARAWRVPPSPETRHGASEQAS